MVVGGGQYHLWLQPLAGWLESMGTRFRRATAKGKKVEERVGVDAFGRRRMRKDKARFFKKPPAQMIWTVPKAGCLVLQHVHQVADGVGVHLPYVAHGCLTRPTKLFCLFVR